MKNKIAYYNGLIYAATASNITCGTTFFFFVSVVAYPFLWHEKVYFSLLVVVYGGALNILWYIFVSCSGVVPFSFSFCFWVHKAHITVY